MKETKQEKMRKVIKKFMWDVTDWINHDYPLDEQFKLMVAEYKEEIEQLEDK